MKDTRIGDEAFMVGIFKVTSFEGATVMRHGRTVALYTRPGEIHPTRRRSEYGGVEAARMADKLTRTPL
ncbi:hypothetical protein ACLQ2R_25505 [Streptosporangium sp. DT93]|uniref:hypothetical protein n=1 Tax=Streptosporangium sp. DT93 TaxID=3393428 RepID=UPI003CE6A780